MSLTGNTLFITYGLSSDLTNSKSYGYSDAVHCNYINKTTLNNINSEITLSFGNNDYFKFLNNDLAGWTGFTATKFFAIVQLVDNSLFTSVNNIKPDSTKWKVYDLTSQTYGYVSGNLLSKTSFANVSFKISVNPLYYNPKPFYTLDYLNYSDALSSNGLNFGDETFFYGNVTTDIEAIAYNTDLSISLPKGSFNASSNPTWVNTQPVLITEVGLYSENNGIKELVAIGKLNRPIKKDSNIQRSILFGIDF